MSETIDLRCTVAHPVRRCRQTVQEDVQPLGNVFLLEAWKPHGNVLQVHSFLAVVFLLEQVRRRTGTSAVLHMEFGPVVHLSMPGGVEK